MGCAQFWPRQTLRMTSTGEERWVLSNTPEVISNIWKIFKCYSSQVWSQESTFNIQPTLMLSSLPPAHTHAEHMSLQATSNTLHTATSSPTGQNPGHVLLTANQEDPCREDVTVWACVCAIPCPLGFGSCLLACVRVCMRERERKGKREPIIDGQSSIIQTAILPPGCQSCIVATAVVCYQVTVHKQWAEGMGSSTEKETRGSKRGKKTLKRAQERVEVKHADRWHVEVRKF